VALRRFREKVFSAEQKSEGHLSAIGNVLVSIDGLID
jgi:hypothetical protein